MPASRHRNPEWVTRGKTIRQLMAELRAFDEPDAEVRLSLDNGESDHCVSIVQRQSGKCVLVNSEAYHRGEWQAFMDENADPSDPGQTESGG